jgi:hypothetical protein
MIIRITSKLAKKLNIPLSLIEAGNEPSINEWYGNLFTFHRTQYILLTNEKTLFSFVLPGKGISNNNLLLKKMSAQLKEMLEDYKLNSVWEKNFITEFSKITFSKTFNRRVLGTMNELIFHATILLEKEEISLHDLSFELNTLIYSLISYKKPIEAFKEYFKI